MESTFSNLHFRIARLIKSKNFTACHAVNIFRFSGPIILKMKDVEICFILHGAVSYANMWKIS